MESVSSENVQTSQNQNDSICYEPDYDCDEVILIYLNPNISQAGMTDFSSQNDEIELNPNDLIFYDPNGEDDFTEVANDPDLEYGITHSSSENVEFESNDLICYDPDGEDELMELANDSDLKCITHSSSQNAEIDLNPNDLICYDPNGEDDFMDVDHHPDLEYVHVNRNTPQESGITNSSSQNVGIELNSNDLICYDPDSEDELMEVANDADLESVDSTRNMPQGDDGLEIYQGRPNRGRKRKVSTQSRTDRKRLFNTNKPHINTKGNPYVVKFFDEEFECPCSMNCTTIIDLEERRRLFNQYWDMGTFEGRCALLVTCAKQNLKKRTYTKQHLKNRLVTGTYSIFGTVVCQRTLLRTLRISYRRLDTSLNKHLNRHTYRDGRGKVSGGANKLPLSKRNEIRNHIKSFPKYVSHYARSQTESKFLGPTLNLAKIYRLYKAKHSKPVSMSCYKQVFYKDFNLRFKNPKKDTCSKCDVFDAKKKAATESNRLVLDDLHNEHLDRASILRTQMDYDLAMAKVDDELETLTFDQQKIHSFPMVRSNIVYYLRQLNVYNFGIHVGSTRKGIFHIWLENEGSKGTQEVGSCLKMYIENMIGPKRLILWSDACGGQNRSIKLILMLMYILQHHPTLESISMRYREPGHSFLPNDSDFKDLECALKHEDIYTDTQFMHVAKNCRLKNKFDVKRLSSKDFLSVKNLESAITNRKIDINHQKINWFNTHEIFLEKSQPTIMKMRKSIDGNFQTVNIEKTGCGLTPILKSIVLDELWPQGKALSKLKVKDLNCMLKLVPDEHKHFYAFLEDVAQADFIDDVEGFGESIDFELE